MIVILKDRDDNNVDGVIITKTTTVAEIEGIIEDIESHPYDDTIIDQIRRRLPADCELHTIWNGNLDSVLY